MKRSKPFIEGAALYGAIVAQARRPAFYARLVVPDSVEGRFEMIVLHVALILRRLRREPVAGQGFGQALVEYMFADLDRSIREIGVGDMSVGKYMKRLGKSFYGRAAAYDRALDAGDHGLLADSVRRNILATGEAEEDHQHRAADEIAAYVEASDRALQPQTIGDLGQGRVAFAPLEREPA